MSSRLSDDFHGGSQPVSSLIASNASRLRVSAPASSPALPAAAAVAANTTETPPNAHLLALEMQNRELRASLRKAEQQRSRYFELFESSPIAYFIFDERHHLHDLNLAAGTLLPGERSKLKHRPFFPHLTDDDRTRFHRHLTEVFHDRTPSSISLKLINGGSKPRTYRFLSQTAPSTPGEPALVVSAVLRESEPPAAPATPSADSTRVGGGNATNVSAMETAGGLGLSAQKVFTSKPSSEREPGVLPASHTALIDGHEAGRILLVDDEAGVRMVIARMLESLGYAVEEASNGTEALARFAQNPTRYRWVVSDMNMPGMNGLFLAHELRRQSSDIRCVIMSGLSELGSDGGMSGDSGIVFLQKPFTLPCLEEALMKTAPPFIPSAAIASVVLTRPPSQTSS